jgi:hypothetical protein
MVDMRLLAVAGAWFVRCATVAVATCVASGCRAPAPSLAHKDVDLLLATRDDGEFLRLSMELRSLMPGATHELIRGIQEAPSRTKDRRKAFALLRILGAFPPTLEASNYAERCADSSVQGTRVMGYALLSDFGRPKDEPRMLSGLSDSYLGIRGLCLMYFRRRPSPAALPKVRELAADSDSTIRSEVAPVLVWARSRSDLAILERLVHDPEYIVRDNTAEALMDAKAPDYVPLIKQLARDPDPRLRNKVNAFLRTWKEDSGRPGR